MAITTPAGANPPIYVTPQEVHEASSLKSAARIDALLAAAPSEKLDDQLIRFKATDVASALGKAGSQKLAAPVFTAADIVKGTGLSPLEVDMVLHPRTGVDAGPGVVPWLAKTYPRDEVIKALRAENIDTSGLENLERAPDPRIAQRAEAVAAADAEAARVAKDAISAEKLQRNAGQVLLEKSGEFDPGTVFRRALGQVIDKPTKTGPALAMPFAAGLAMSWLAPQDNAGSAFLVNGSGIIAATAGAGLLVHHKLKLPLHATLATAAAGGVALLGAGLFSVVHGVGSKS
ncbi:MAG: hypothetical protein JWO69_1019 [Thermoleophilia bacterium]|jgi:hypothetical protein|nr:hypothetical protein [Thermoleophilia bacterium]